MVLPASADRMSPTALRVLAALRAQSSLGASILKTQCELAGIDRAALTEEDMSVLYPRLVAALGRFVTSEKVAAFRKACQKWDDGTREPSTVEFAVCNALQSNPPSEGVAAEVLTLLAPITPLAVAMLKAQCVRANLDLKTLTRQDLSALAPLLVAALERFTSPEKAELVRQQLRALMLARSDGEP